MRDDHVLQPQQQIRIDFPFGCCFADDVAPLQDMADQIAGRTQVSGDLGLSGMAWWPGVRAVPSDAELERRALDLVHGIESLTEAMLAEQVGRAAVRRLIDGGLIAVRTTGDRRGNLVLTTAGIVTLTGTMRLTPRTAYDAGCRNGNRAGTVGRMYWRDGQPEVSDAEVRADALDSFAVMMTGPWEDSARALPAITARGDIEQLTGEYARGFAGARQAAIEAEAALDEIDPLPAGGTDGTEAVPE